MLLPSTYMLFFALQLVRKKPLFSSQQQQQMTPRSYLIWTLSEFAFITIRQHHQKKAQSKFSSLATLK